jgi:hypothetical protein
MDRRSGVKNDPVYYGFLLLGTLMIILLFVNLGLAH